MIFVIAASSGPALSSQVLTTYFSFQIVPNITVALQLPFDESDQGDPDKCQEDP